MEIHAYTDGQRKTWSEFVQTAANGTIFHLPEFLDYHPPGRFAWHHLMFGAAGDPVSVLPAAVEIDAQGYKTLKSPAGATLGGPAIRSRLGVEHTKELVAALLDYAQQNAFDFVVLGTVPTIYWPQPDDTLEFVLRDAGFTCTPQLEHYVDLRAIDPSDVMQSIPGKRRYRYRRALQQGLQLTVATTTEQIADFYRVLVANKQAHGAAPVHTLAEVCDLQERLGSRLRIVLAQKDGTTPAAVYSIAVNGRVCYTQYIVDDPSARDLDAARFLLFHLLTLLRQDGFLFFDLGPSVTLPVESCTLAHFKESLGAVGCERRQWTFAFRSRRQ